MAAPTTPEEAIEQAALGPASATSDGTTVVNADTDKLIRVANRAAANRAAASTGLFGCHTKQLLPPGANR